MSEVWLAVTSIPPTQMCWSKVLVQRSALLALQQLWAIGVFEENDRPDHEAFLFEAARTQFLLDRNPLRHAFVDSPSASYVNFAHDLQEQTAAAESACIGSPTESLHCPSPQRSALIGEHLRLHLHLNK